MLVQAGAGVLAAGGVVALVSGATSSRASAATAGAMTAAGAAAGASGWVSVVSFGADPSGATDSTAAIQAAISALPATGGVVYLPAGTYQVSSTLTCTTVPAYFQGDGAWATTLAFTGTGDCVRIYDPTGYSSRTRFSGGFCGITIDGASAKPGAVGLHLGDLLQYQFDMTVQNFTGAGSIGIHLDNAYYWTEQLRGRIYAQNCASHVVFDCSGTLMTSSGSFERCDLDIYINQWQAAFDGVVFRNGAFTGNGSLRIRGNFGSSPSPVTSAVLRLTGSTPSGRQYPSNAGIQNGLVDIGVECTPGTYTPQTIAFGSSANTISGCSGALNFGIAGDDKFAPSNNAGNVNGFQGPITGDSTLPGSWVTYSSGLPAGWTGHVSCRFLPTGNEVMVSWALTIASGTAVSRAQAIVTLGSRFHYTDNKVLPGNITGGGLNGNQYAPASVTPTGAFQYNGPALGGSGAAWWYGQGVYTLTLG